ncbi:MAG TPA: Mut7-C RNAse domain-containing protein [Bryobacteraceae bacterium]
MEEKRHRGATILTVTDVPVWFRFHGELNDFLTANRRNIEFAHAAGSTDTIKHVIESLGVPHTEIGRIRVNGQIAPASARVTEGDHLEVYPHPQPVILDQARFVLDGHLGRLAAYLRMLGFDVWYDRFADDARLAAVSGGEGRSRRSVTATHA